MDVVILVKSISTVKKRVEFSDVKHGVHIKLF